MSYTQNNFSVRGYVNYLKEKPMNDGTFIYVFSVSLAAGKDKEGNFKKEYMTVEVSSNCSASSKGKIDSGDFVQIEGRVRNRSYQKQDGSKGFYTYLEAFDLFVLNKGTPQQQTEQPRQSYQQQQPRQPYQQQRPPQQPPQQAWQGAGNNFVPNPAPQQPPQQAPQQPPQQLDLNKIPF